MSRVTILWSMISSACLTLAVIQLLVWFQNRRSMDRFALGLLALATAAMALIEIHMMKSADPAAHATALRWQHVPVWVIFFSICGFARFHLHAGRPWLGWMAVGLRGVSLVLNFSVGENLNYLSITSMRQVSFLGDVVYIPIGTPNPCMLLGQLSLLLMVVFVMDATRTAWKQGNRRRAVISGGAIIAFVAMGSLHAVLAHWQVVGTPAVVSLFFTGMVVIMAFEVSRDALRAAKLAEELRTTREVKTKEVAHLGRVAALGELSVSLAHEMNQPLGIILSNAQAARRLLAKESPDLKEVGHILDDIVSEDLRASEVIQRMRALLRRGEVNHQPLDVNSVAAEVLLLMRNTITERQVRLSECYTPDIPKVSADRVQIQQVLLNLLLNACEAMDENPPGQRRISLSTHADENSVHLSVEDCGRGIPTLQEKIFEPFHTTKPQGLGMGLAICRSIITAHHGQLWAEPAVPSGAVFHMVLPILKS